MKVEEVMTRDVVTVQTDASLKQVAAVLAAHRISGVPVVDDQDEVVGVVSEADILGKERGPSEPRSVLERMLHPHATNGRPKLEARTAAEAMTAPAKTTVAWRSVAAVAGQMLDDGINRLPVVDKDGKLVGIVTRADLVRAFVRSDTEIRQEIENDVLARTLLLPEPVTVAVDDGRVRLGGSVDKRADAELVPTIVAKVPGVVEVESEISWRRDDGRRGLRSAV